MSEQTNNGGPAFPHVRTSAETVGSSGDYQTYGNVESFGGMTLRDYFASKAMASMDYNHNSDDVLARNCYKFADAMLAARGDA